MARVIDLSTTIARGHFRWQGEQHLHRTHAHGHTQITWLSGSVHAVTHIDVPRHFDPARIATEANLLEFPGERIFVVCAPLKLAASDRTPAQVLALDGFG